MDPIQSFIQSKKRFSLDLLTTAYSRLSVLQLQRGCVTQEDTNQSLRSQLIGQRMSAAEIGGHAGLLFESIISASISATGQVKLAINKDVIGNDEKFIAAILAALASKCVGVDYPAFDDFQRECQSYLRMLSDAANPVEETPLEQPTEAALPPPEFSFDRPAPKIAHLMPVPPPLPQTTPVLSQMQPPTGVAGQPTQATPSGQSEVEYDGPEEHKYAPARVEFERAEPIVRLLAQVRKVGMDILFPQSTHDKILAIIFVAVRSFATPAHRELIDMVMTVKESNKVSQLEPVSKTKIRGVLALLKHGELLITQGEYGEPVRLSLAPGIETFKDLRERHDAFLSMYMMDHHLFIPAVLRTELVWQLDEETRAMRLDAMDKLVLKLKHFFSGLAEYSANAIDRDSSDSASGVASSDSSSLRTQGQGYGNNQAPGQGYGGRGVGAGPAGKYGLGMGGPMNGMPGMPGGRGGGRGYGAPYGGRGGGRYGGHYNNNYYGANFEGGYGNGSGAGAGGGYGYGGPAGSGGRYHGGYQSRAAAQRMANAQASLNWANNEDYAEMANEDWGAAGGSDSKTVSSNTSVSSHPHSQNSRASSMTGGYSNNNNNVTKLSPQAPSFDPVKIKGGPSVSVNTEHPHRTLTPKGSMSNMGGEMLSFDYARLPQSSTPTSTAGGGGGIAGSLSSSRLASLNGLALIDAKDSSSGRLDHSSLDDAAWLTAAAAGGRANYDFWNDTSSSFFDTVGGGDVSHSSGHSHGQHGHHGQGVHGVKNASVDSDSASLGFSLGNLSLNRSFASSTGAPGLYSTALDINSSLSGVDHLDLSFESRLDRALVHSGALDNPHHHLAHGTAAGATGTGGAVAIGSGNGEAISPIPQAHSPLPGASSAGFFADSSLGTSTAAGVQG